MSNPVGEILTKLRELFTSPAYKSLFGPSSGVEMRVQAVAELDTAGAESSRSSIQHFRATIEHDPERIAGD